MAFIKANDVIELAMQLEKSGEAYYRAVAAKVASPQAKALFQDLADQEVMHYKIFAKFAQAVSEKPLMLDQEWDQYQQYLEATIQSTLFEGPEKALAAAQAAADEKEALHMAIRFEKETMFFFYDIRDMVPQADQEMIDKVIAEEKKHVRRLAAML